MAQLIELNPRDEVKIEVDLNTLWQRTRGDFYVHHIAQDEPGNRMIEMGTSPQYKHRLGVVKFQRPIEVKSGDLIAVPNERREDSLSLYFCFNVMRHADETPEGHYEAQIAHVYYNTPEHFGLRGEQPVDPLAAEGRRPTEAVPVGEYL